MSCDTLKENRLSGRHATGMQAPIGRAQAPSRLVRDASCLASIFNFELCIFNSAKPFYHNPSKTQNGPAEIIENILRPISPVRFRFNTICHEPTTCSN